MIGLIFFSGTSVYQWVWLPAWPIASVLIVNFLATRPRHGQLKQLGRQAKVIGTNYPQLHRLLTEQTQLLGLKKSPDMYVISDESPYICSLPSGSGAVIVTQSLLDLLSDEELATLLAHELAHIRFHHLRLEVDAAQMERYFKISQFVNDQPNMRDRLEEIQEFAASDEAQAGWEKIAQLRQELGLDHSAAA